MQPMGDSPTGTLALSCREGPDFIDIRLRPVENPSIPTYFPMNVPCKHPIVKVVARQDDAEFVECQACGEVFDSVEFNDIALEEKEGLGAEEAEG